MTLVQRQGVHQLLATEIRALEKINEAKKRRLIRLKQAREEATAEINKFREELEAKFVKREREFADNREIIKMVEEQTKKELEEMEKTVQQNRQAVVQRLMELVCDIQPELHHNLLLQKKIFLNEKNST